MEGLGRLFDISPDIAPVDLHTAANTGLRYNVKAATGITFLLAKAASATATDNLVLTLNEWLVKTGGAAKTVGIPFYFYKLATTLAATETWTKVWNTSDGTSTGTVNSTLTFKDSAGGNTGAKQALLAFYVGANHLDEGYDYVSLDIAAAATTTQLGTVLTIGHDLTAERDPANMKAGLY